MVDEGKQRLEKAAAQLESWGLETHRQMYADNISKRKAKLEKFCQLSIPYKSNDHSHSPVLKMRETDFKTTEYNFDGHTITMPEFNEKLSERDI